MSAHEYVIRFRHPFSVTVDGKWQHNVREIAIPFADRMSAEAAGCEITTEVRPVHDAGGEDYRPVVAGEVIKEPRELIIGEASPCA